MSCGIVSHLLLLPLLTDNRRQDKPNAQVYIGDLHPDVSETDLQTPFEKFGPIRLVNEYNLSSNSPFPLPIVN